MEVGLLPRVWGDPTLLYRLLLNLVTDALKFREPSRMLILEIDATPTRIFAPFVRQTV